MFHRIIETIRRRTWARILAAILLAACCWLAWWAWGHAPFPTRTQEPAPATQTAQAKSKRTPSKPETTKPAASSKDVSEWVKTMGDRIDKAYGEIVADGTVTIRQVIKDQQSEDRPMDDHYDQVKELEYKLSDLGKEYTAKPAATSEEAQSQLDSLNKAFDRWRDALWGAAWKDLYNRKSSMHWASYRYALEGVPREEMPEACQSYFSHYGVGMGDYDLTWSNRKLLDWAKKWFKGFEDSLTECLSQPNDQMADNMMKRDLGDASTLGQ